jgi:hypothetical protein
MPKRLLQDVKTAKALIAYVLYRKGRTTYQEVGEFMGHGASYAMALHARGKRLVNN